MLKCAFCKNESDRPKHKYCNKCHQLYKNLQKSINPKQIEFDSDQFHIRNFRFCSFCKKKLCLPRKRSCALCDKILTKDYFIKVKMRSLTQYHLRKRNIKKPLFCEYCNRINPEGHHDNYNKPLNIRWLCKKHHVMLHVEERKEKGL